MTTAPTAPPELLDLDTLEALARAATPGGWIAKPHGRIVGGPLRHYVNGSAQQQLAMMNVTIHDQDGDDVPDRQQANTEFIAGANPAAVLALIALARRAQPYATGGIVPGGLHLAGEASQAACAVPPDGWHCTRAPGHDGPCAAWPIAQQAAALGALEKSARALAEKWHKDAVDTGFATSETAVELLEVLDAATSSPGTPEAPKKPAHGHRDDYYLLANGRRLGLESISRVRNMPNWVLAMELFATGSGSAYQICRDAGVDPEGTTIQRAAQLDGGQGEGQ